MESHFSAPSEERAPDPGMLGTADYTVVGTSLTSSLDTNSLLSRSTGSDWSSSSVSDEGTIWKEAMRSMSSSGMLDPMVGGGIR